MPAFAAVAAALALGVAACGGGDEEHGEQRRAAAAARDEELTGTIRIDGSSTVFPFAEAAGELFNEEQPNVQVTVGQSGTGGGFEKFCAGETDVSTASRPIKDDEEAPVCEKAGIKYEEVQVANDGIAVVTNKNLTVDCLTVDQLKAIWEPKSKVKNLSEAGDGLPSAELKLFGPGTDSGTFDFFTEQINGEEGASREDYEASEDDNQLVTGVSGTAGRPRLLRLLLLRAEHRQAQPGRRRRGRGHLQEARRGLDPGRLLHAARRARCSCTRPTRRCSVPRSRRSWSSSSTTRRRSPRRPRSSR